MKSPKVIGGILIIGLLVFVFLVIFGNSLEKSIEAVKPAKINISSRHSESVSESTKILNPRKASHGAQQVQDDGEGARNDSEWEEATERMGEKIAKSIVDLNVEGFTELNDQQFAKAFNPQKIVDEVLQQELGEIERLSAVGSKPVVEIPATEIISNVTGEQKENYLRSVIRISEESKAGIVGLKISSSAHLEQLVEIYDQAADRLRRLSVPQELSSFHKEGISLLLWQASIWKKLANADDEPLEAIVALKQHEQVQRELQAFERLINDYIEENKLAIQW